MHTSGISKLNLMKPHEIEIRLYINIYELWLLIWEFYLNGWSCEYVPPPVHRTVRWHAWSLPQRCPSTSVRHGFVVATVTWRGEGAGWQRRWQSQALWRRKMTVWVCFCVCSSVIVSSVIHRRLTWYPGDLTQKFKQQLKCRWLMLTRTVWHGCRQLLQQKNPHLDQTCTYRLLCTSNTMQGKI